MQPKLERALVGVFVLVAAGLLVVTIVSLTGGLGRNQPVYHAYFKNAGGLAPGSEVRYAGGPPVGRVLSVVDNPDDPTRLEISFRVDPHVPLKTDSKVKITTFGPLGDNFLGIVPGTAAAPRAPAGSVVPSVDYAGFDELATKINDLAPQVTVLVQNINGRVTELQETIRRVNALLDDQNRANIAADLAEVHGLLAEDRPLLHSTLNNLNGTSAKLAPLLDDFKNTANQADTALSHLDAVVVENRPDLREAVSLLRTTLTSAAALTDQLNSILNTNDDNIDQIVENLRAVTDNLKVFTEIIKTRPSTLIRSSSPQERVPGLLPKRTN